MATRSGTNASHKLPAALLLVAMAAVLLEAAHLLGGPIATGLMAAAAAGVLYLLRDGSVLDPSDSSEAFVLVAVCAAAGGLVYLGVSLALRLSEPALLLSRLPVPRRLSARGMETP